MTRHHNCLVWVVVVVIESFMDLGNSYETLKAGFDEILRNV